MAKVIIFVCSLILFFGAGWNCLLKPISMFVEKLFEMHFKVQDDLSICNKFLKSTWFIGMVNKKMFYLSLSLYRFKATIKTTVYCQKLFGSNDV